MRGATDLGMVKMSEQMGREAVATQAASPDLLQTTERTIAWMIGDRGMIAMAEIVDRQGTADMQSQEQDMMMEDLDALRLEEPPIPSQIVQRNMSAQKIGARSRIAKVLVIVTVEAGVTILQTITEERDEKVKGEMVDELHESSRARLRRCPICESADTKMRRHSSMILREGAVEDSGCPPGAFPGNMSRFDLIRKRWRWW